MEVPRRKTFAAVALIVFAGIGVFIWGCSSSTLDDGTDGDGVPAFSAYSIENGLADNAVTDITVDYVRNGVWLTTRNGLSFFSNADSSLTTYGAETALPDMEMTSVTVDPTGTVWVGTVTGIGYLSLTDSLFRMLNDGGNLASRWVTDILVRSDLSQWFGTRGGISVKKSSVWTSYTTVLGPSSSITSLALDSQNRVWAGSTEGIAMYDGVSWTQYGAAVLPSTYVNVVYADQGKLWVGTASIATVYDGSRWQAYGVADGLPATGVFDFVRDQSGTLWTAAGTGVYSLDGDTWKQLSLPSEVTGATVNALAADSMTGSLWIGTNSGALRYSSSGQ